LATTRRSHRRGQSKVWTFLRVVHVAALAIVVFAMAVHVWAWFRFHLLEVLSARELGNLGGLLVGVVFGVAILWTSTYLSSTSIRTTIVLHVGWLLIFTWYWFNLFPLGEIRELHSFEAWSLEREQAQQAKTSVGFFLLWVGLYSIGPILKARDVRE
jgi:hypothetical protein